MRILSILVIGVFCIAMSCHRQRLADPPCEFVRPLSIEYLGVHHRQDRWLTLRFEVTNKSREALPMPLLDSTRLSSSGAQVEWFDGVRWIDLSYQNGTIPLTPMSAGQSALLDASIEIPLTAAETHRLQMRLRYASNVCDFDLEVNAGEAK